VVFILLHARVLHPRDAPSPFGRLQEAPGGIAFESSARPTRSEAAPPERRGSRTGLGNSLVGYQVLRK
jgi:hypothetical protein